MGTPLIWHENIESFLQASLEDLKRDEALNNLILGLCLRIQENPPDYYPDVKMVTVRAGAQLSLAALIAVPERPILYGGGERDRISQRRSSLKRFCAGGHRCARRHWVARFGIVLFLPLAGAGRLRCGIGYGSARLQTHSSQRKSDKSGGIKAGPCG